MVHFHAGPPLLFGGFLIQAVFYARRYRPSTDNAANLNAEKGGVHNSYEIISAPSRGGGVVGERYSALSAYSAQQQTYTRTLMLESKAVRPSRSHLKWLSASANLSKPDPRGLHFILAAPLCLVPSNTPDLDSLRSFHPHSHGNSFSLARGRRQPWVQLAGFTLEILFITLAAMLISCSVAAALFLPRSPSLSLSGGSRLNIFPVLKFMDFSSIHTYIQFPAIVKRAASPHGNCAAECQE